MAFKYQYVLTEVPFDSSYENAIRFDTREQQEEYFKVSTLFNSNTPSINFDFGNLLETEIVIKSDESPLKVMGYNYLILKNNNESKPDYLYYFINSIEYLSGGNDEFKTQVRLSLSLDVINSYLLDIEFGDGVVIKRASLNRWKDNTKATETGPEPNVIFNLDTSTIEGSLLYQTDDWLENKDKIINSRDEIVFNYCKGTYANHLFAWCVKNIDYWIYIYFDPTATYKAKKYKSDFTGDEYNINSNNLQGCSYIKNGKETYGVQYGCMCFPIYKGNEYLRFKTDYDTYDGKGYIGSIFDLTHKNQNFDKLVTGTNGFISIKMSKFPPCFINATNVEYEKGKGYTFTNCQDHGDLHYTSFDMWQDSQGNTLYANVSENLGSIWNIPIDLDMKNKREISLSKTYIKNDFDPLELINTNKKLMACPVLHKKELQTIEFQSIGGNIEYEPLSLYGKDNFSTLYLIVQEIQTPELNKAYIRLAPTGIYTSYTEDNLSGLVSTYDNGAMIITDSVASFYANNKNYWLQSLASSIGGGFPDITRYFKVPTTQTYTRTESGGKNDYYINKAGIRRLTGEHPTWNTSVLTGGFNKPDLSNLTYDMVHFGFNTASNLLNKGLTYLNVKASNGNIKNATTDSIFNYATLNFNYYVSHNIACQETMQSVYDYYYEYGYPVNIVGRIEDYINIRHYFNYLQADLQNISGKNGVCIPNEVRNKIKLLFSDGIRFWNVTDEMFKYEKENYENWLLEYDS